MRSGSPRGGGQRQDRPGRSGKSKTAQGPGESELDAAIEQFEEAVGLDPSLLEARLNLGEVYLSLNELDKAELPVPGNRETAIGPSEKDQETINNYSQACFGLGENRHDPQKLRRGHRVPARRRCNGIPENAAALQIAGHASGSSGASIARAKSAFGLAGHAAARSSGGTWRSNSAGSSKPPAKTKEAVQAWNFLAWAFATSPEPHILDPRSGDDLPDAVVEMTKQQDPPAMDTLAAAQAASGQYGQAVQAAQVAINWQIPKARSRWPRPFPSVCSYQQGKPYRCDPTAAIGRKRP